MTPKNARHTKSTPLNHLILGLWNEGINEIINVTVAAELMPTR
jgi:hypothetical protein